MPRGKRAAAQTQISVSLPRRLLENIDALAAEDHRTRSNWIVAVIERKVKH